MEKVKNFLKDRGVSLVSIGINAYALKKSDALEFLNILEQEKVPVLGGEAFSWKDNCLTLTYDNWFCNRDDSKNKDCFLLLSLEKARNFIENYPDPSVLYEITVDAELNLFPPLKFLLIPF